MATQLIFRRVMALGGLPSIRAGILTDNGNSIIDVTGLLFAYPIALETELNQLPGAVCNGVFARRRADVSITAGTDGILVQPAQHKEVAAIHQARRCPDCSLRVETYCLCAS